MCLSLSLTWPSLIARSLYTHNMCALFDYAGYAAARALVETKKKEDILTLTTYTGYMAARAPVEQKKKKNISYFHTYTVFLSLSLVGREEKFELKLFS